MKRRSGRQLRALGLLSCILLSAGSAPALLRQDDSSTTSVLLSRARILEARGRLDLAKQDWTQVLAVDPNNAEALGGLARVAKAEGKSDEAAQFLSRLRAANPKAAEPARSESSAKARDVAAQVNEAGLLARAGDTRAAMTIYRQVYGLNPPPGEPALAYYAAEAATADGRPHAVAGLRALADRFPTDRRYKLALGKALLLNPRTLGEGREILEGFPGDPQALEALRQSGAATVAVSGRAISSGSQGQAGTRRLPPNTFPTAQPGTGIAAKTTSPIPAPPPQSPARGVSPGIATAQSTKSTALTRTSDTSAAVNAQPPSRPPAHVSARDEQIAYSALNAHHLPEAEERFRAILAQDPGAARALAGMAYTRVEQGNLAEAIRLFEEAQEHGDHSLALVRALAGAQLSLQVQHADAARTAGDLSRAEQEYADLLRGKPDNVPALAGLGETFLEEHKPESAVPVFAKLTQVRPSEIAGWRGLVIAQVGAKRPAEAIQTDAKASPEAKRTLANDGQYVQALRSAGQMTTPAAPAPAQVASMEKPPEPNRSAPAPATPAKPNQAAPTTVTKPNQAAPATVTKPIQEPSTTVTVQPPPRPKPETTAPKTPTVAQPAEKSTAAKPRPSASRAEAIRPASVPPPEVRKPQPAPSTPAVAVSPASPTPADMLGEARRKLEAGGAAEAARLYSEVLSQNRQSAEAWKGLLSAWHRMGRDADAGKQVAEVPASAMDVLNRDPSFVELMGAVFLGQGDERRAVQEFGRAQALYVSQHAAPPLPLEFAIARLLFESGDEGNLYRELMELGGRQDLTDGQRRSVQRIWTDWALRRARALSAAGEQRRAVVVLNAAAEAFVGNAEVLRLVANGYTQAGMAKQALALYKSQDATSMSASDLESAISAATAARDFHQARTWIQVGLQRFPKSPEMLLTAGEAEQVRGDKKRAAAYFQSAQSLSPAVSPGSVLAAELGSYPGARSLSVQPGSTGSLSLVLRPRDVNALATQPVPGRLYLPSYADRPSSTSGSPALVPDLLGREGH